MIKRGGSYTQGYPHVWITGDGLQGPAPSGRNRGLPRTDHASTRPATKGGNALPAPACGTNTGQFRVRSPRRAKDRTLAHAGMSPQEGGSRSTGPICFAISFEPFHRAPRLRLRLARPQYSVAGRRSTCRECALRRWLPRASSGSQLDPVPRRNSDSLCVERRWRPSNAPWRGKLAQYLETVTRPRGATEAQLP